MKIYITRDLWGCEISDVKPEWNLHLGGWVHEDEGLLDQSSECMLRAILNLDHWPEDGEMLIYDTVKEEGEIHVPNL